MAIKPLFNEKELLQRIADGDSRAFADLFRAYQEPLAKYIYTLLDSVQQCEEIVQDIFLKIWENRSALPLLNNFVSYLFILTRNYTIDNIRKQEVSIRKDKQYADDFIKYNQIEDTLRTDEAYADLLKKAVSQLPPSQQKVLAFRQQGLKTREIAEKMGISMESVKKYQQWAAGSVARYMNSHTSLLIILFLIRR